VQLAGSWRRRRKRGSLRTGRVKPKGRAATTRRAGTSCSGPSYCRYSPECVEGAFRELRLFKVLEFRIWQDTACAGADNRRGHYPAPSTSGARPDIRRGRGGHYHPDLGGNASSPRCLEVRFSEVRMQNPASSRSDRPRNPCLNPLSTRPTAAGTCAMDTRLPEFRPGAQTASPADRQGFLCTIHREVPI
jgi:hypothetical protein